MTRYAWNDVNFSNLLIRPRSGVLREVFIAPLSVKKLPVLNESLVFITMLTTAYQCSLYQTRLIEPKVSHLIFGDPIQYCPTIYVQIFRVLHFLQGFVVGLSQWVNPILFQSLVSTCRRRQINCPKRCGSFNMRRSFPKYHFPLLQKKKHQDP